MGKTLEYKYYDKEASMKRTRSKSKKMKERVIEKMDLIKEEKEDDVNKIKININPSNLVYSQENNYNNSNNSSKIINNQASLSLRNNYKLISNSIIMNEEETKASNLIPITNISQPTTNTQIPTTQPKSILKSPKDSKPTKNFPSISSSSINPTSNIPSNIPNKNFHRKPIKKSFT